MPKWSMTCWRREISKPISGGVLVESFNGKPQSLLLKFAYAYGSPLHENDQYTIESTFQLRPGHDGGDQAFANLFRIRAANLFHDHADQWADGVLLACSEIACGFWF